MTTMFEQSQQQYSQRAEEYDQFVKHRASNFEQVHKATLQAMAKLNISFLHKTILDFGAGQGRDSAYLKGKCSYIHAYEPCEAMRDVFIQNVPDVPCFGRDEFLINIGHDIRPPVTYDLIWASAVIQHLDDEEFDLFVRWVTRSVEIGGHVIITRRLTPYDDNDGRPFAALESNEAVPRWPRRDEQGTLWDVLLDDRTQMDYKRGVAFQTVILQRVASPGIPNL